MAPLTRGTAILFLILSALSLVSGVVTYRSIVHTRAQVSKMHTMAVEHHSYEPSQRWKHDENVLVNQANADGRLFSVEISGVVIFALALLAVVVRERRVKVVRHVEYVDRYVQPPEPHYQPPRIVEARSLVASALPAPQHDLASALRAASNGDAFDKRVASGELGHAIVKAALRPLLESGWTLIGEKIPVKIVENGKEVKCGDIDFLLRAPLGTGFSLDAKNGNETVYYDRKKRNVVFKSRWYNRREYPVQRAWTLADWAADVYGLARVLPIMCFTESVNLQWEKSAYGVRLVRVPNLVALLTRLAYEVPAKTGTSWRT